jgi:hypothetical protein
MVERGLVKKVSNSSLKMSVVKKSISAWLDWAKQRKKIKKVVKKFSKSYQKVVKHFVKPGKNSQKRDNIFFLKNWV